MVEGMNNPEMDDHGPTSLLALPLLVESYKPGVLGDIGHYTREWTRIDVVDRSEWRSIHDRTRNSWVSSMADTLVVWEAIGNAGHLGPNYGKKAYLMRDAKQSRLHKALQQSVTAAMRMVMLSLPSAPAGFGHANGVETDASSD